MRDERRARPRAASASQGGELGGAPATSAGERDRNFVLILKPAARVAASHWRRGKTLRCLFDTPACYPLRQKSGAGLRQIPEGAFLRTARLPELAHVFSEMGGAPWGCEIFFISAKRVFVAKRFLSVAEKLFV